MSAPRPALGRLAAVLIGASVLVGLLAIATRVLNASQTDVQVFESERAEPVAIACSLSAVAATERQRDWADLLARALVRRTRVVDGLRVELEDLSGVRSELQRLVAAERECCPFLAMRIHTEGAAGALTVTAPPQAGPILEELFAEDRR